MGVNPFHHFPLTTMLTLLLGLVLFLGVHSLQALAPAWRAQRRAQWGERVYKGVYALLALLGLWLIVQGYGEARQAPVLLWQPPRMLMHISWLLMWLSMVLLVAAYVPANAIQARLGHPMTLGVKVWALAHLLVNGTLADAMLFGTFLIWAVLVFRSARRREPGPRVARASSLWGTGLALLLGSGLWALLLWGGLHARWIGVDPLGGLGV
jgi:uncharacterized membrane protein